MKRSRNPLMGYSVFVCIGSGALYLKSFDMMIIHTIYLILILHY